MREREKERREREERERKERTFLSVAMGESWLVSVCDQLVLSVERLVSLMAGSLSLELGSSVCDKNVKLALDVADSNVNDDGARAAATA